MTTKKVSRHYQITSTWEPMSLIFWISINHYTRLLKSEQSNVCSCHILSGSHKWYLVVWGSVSQTDLLIGITWQSSKKILMTVSMPQRLWFHWSEVWSGLWVQHIGKFGNHQCKGCFNASQSGESLLGSMKLWGVIGPWRTSKIWLGNNIPHER